jgi:hypothetical protein
MGKVIYSMGVSLDGFIAGPCGEIAVVPDEGLHRFHNEQSRGCGVHVTRLSPVAARPSSRRWTSAWF